MAVRDAVAAWPKFTTNELIVNVVVILLLAQVVRFLYGGVRIRLKFSQLRAQGFVRTRFPGLDYDTKFN